MAEARVGRSSALVLGVIAAVAAGCAKPAPSATAIARAEEARGIGSDLAGCIGSAAARRMPAADRRRLVSDPDHLPPAIARLLTAIAADCAERVVASSAPP